ncbi:MAG: PEP-CTERM system histidine kinase PrsK [Alphaproteobacteria bacterium]|nr:PEP-CTERM system histidine kinase PrsK [Alphaproteobacteria bacterium]
MTVALWSHLICVLAYAGLSVALLLSARQTVARWGLAAMAAAVSIWALWIVFDLRLELPSPVENWLELARTGALLGFSIFLVSRSLPNRQLIVIFQGGLAFLVLAWAAANVWDPRFQGMAVRDQVALSAAVFGLICLENLIRNAEPERRWSVKSGVIGLGLVFAYDLVFHLVSALHGYRDFELWAARGIVDALAVPLLVLSAIRNPDWVVNLHVSRQVVFHSATAFFAGVVILAGAIGGYYVRRTGDSFASFIQIVMTTVLALGFVVFISSGAARSRLRNFISQNFFSYRYDYRHEWLRFIATIGMGGGLANIRVRAIKAISDIIDSPAGAIWVLDDVTGKLVPGGMWNLGPTLPALSYAGSGLDALIARGDPVPVAEALAKLTDLPPEDRAALAPFWVFVPLSHRSVASLVALMPMRAPRELEWEDYDLLKTVGEQVASYLAEDAAVRQLVEARQLEDFNRRFAFVVHDLKNMASQLQLLVRNADRHGDNPAFQKDLIATVRNAVEKMTKMLEQLSAKRLSEGKRDAAIELASILREVSTRWPAGVVSVSGLEVGCRIRGDHEKLAAALGHLIQNGIEATDGRGPVMLRLSQRGDAGVVEVEDRGKGMDEAFVRDELFKPFRSTKSAGYGIGAFQAREHVREVGGTLSVVSRPGQGTVFTLTFPTVRA